MARNYALFMLQENQREERVYRNRQDAFSLPDDSFKNLFRLPKECVRYVCRKLRSELLPASGNRTVMSVETQVSYLLILCTFQKSFVIFKTYEVCPF